VSSLARSDTLPRTLPPRATLLDGEQLVPLNDHIVCDMEVVPSATQAGILLPTTFTDEDNEFLSAFAKPEPKAGTVLAVGPGALTDGGKRVPPAITVGSRVIVAPTAGIRVPLEGKPLTESSIFCFTAEDVWGVYS